MSDARSVGAVASSPGPQWLEKIGLDSRWARIAQFVVISAQLALLMVLLRLFDIEPGTGLLRILPLVFAGFVVHAALPLAWRLPFFLLLSVAVIGVVLGPVPAAVLIAVGLCLIGLCHLPLPFSTRVVLILVAAVVMVAFRAGWATLPPELLSALKTPGLTRMVLPVLASMFMFRLIIYMYDLRHEERARAGGGAGAARAGAPASIWTRLSYFFLLPNVCFLLFPIVDYRTYRRTYYDTDAQAIYQKGVWWICLGLVYMLGYRLVYHYLIPAPEDVQGLAGIVRFMLAAYLVYLRVVGQFHLIIGLLCLFGFNLPPAHRYYLLASSFTDFWRRARIEWKDFMVKVFYYPALVPLQRKWGPTAALIVATIAVFIVTWLLHSYQWFWLRGDLRFSTTDGVFWTIIGGCVLVNSLLEARGPRVAKPKASSFAVGTAVVHALKVVGMFVFMCVLWSYWGSPSLPIWLSYLTAAEESGPASYALLAGVLAIAVAVGVLAQLIAARIAPKPVASRTPKKEPPSTMALLWRPAAVLTTAALLLFVRVPATNGALAPRINGVVAKVSANQLNAVDQEKEDRGYYEVLLDEPRSTAVNLVVPSAPTSQESDAGEPATDSVVEPSGGGDPDEAPAAVQDSQPEGNGAAPSDSAAKRDRDGLDDVKRDESPAPRDQPATAKPTAVAKPTVTVMLAADARSTAFTPGAGSLQPALANDGGAEPSAQTVQRDTGRVFVGRGRLRPYERNIRDIRMWENVPNYRGSFKGAPLNTNQWGMRDKEYALVPPPRTYRMAFLGSSLTLGAGVTEKQLMEALLEDRLNREGPGAPRRRYEILNFSVGAYGIMQNVAVAEKAFAFAPNAVLVGVFSVDGGRMTAYLQKLVKSGYTIPYPYVQKKLQETGVNSSMQVPELLRRIKPVSEDLIRWSYREIMEMCRQRGVAVIGIVLPEPTPPDRHNMEQSVRLAAAAGLPLLDLRGVYDGLPLDSLHFSDTGDLHWNPRGNKVVADRVYELLRDNDARALRLGFVKKPKSSIMPSTPAAGTPFEAAQRTTPRNHLLGFGAQ